METTICEICFNEVELDILDDHVQFCFQEQLELQEQFNPEDKQIPIEKSPLPNVEIPTLPLVELTKHQIAALNYCNTEAKKNSSKARSSLIKKLQDLKYDEDALHLIKKYIQNIAPILIHFDAKNILHYLCDDMYYRNQFQVSTSRGALDYNSRITWENNLFNSIYGDDDGFYRVKYGPLNFTNDQKGVMAAHGYGTSYLLLRNDLKERTTITYGDSASFQGKKHIGTFNYFYHILDRLAPDLFGQLVKLALGKEISFSSNYGFYLECQYHGEILLERDIEAVILHKSCRGDKEIVKLIERFSKRNKCCITWSD